MKITPEQCRGARAMAGWSRAHLSAQAGVNERTIVDFERGARSPIRATRDAIQRALENAGVEFTNGDQPGVRMRRQGGEG